MKYEYRDKEASRLRHNSVFPPAPRLRRAGRPLTSSSRGFTLVEMIVAFGIFAVIMVIAVGSLMSLIEANHKAQTLKTIVNNLHFALENMSRNIRTGYNYHCGPGGVEIPQSCPEDPESQIVFKSSQQKM